MALTDPWIAYPLLFVAGVATGALNVIAGGGSFLTLPLLIFMGLPAGVANGSNRIGTWLQSASAIWSFERAGVLDRRFALLAAGPATVGAGLGTWLALRVGDESFERILALLMVGISLASFWRPRPQERFELEPGRVALLAAGFFVVGIYGGFVQAGVGFLLLAVTSFGGLDLVRGNAVKVVTILVFTTLSLALFAWNGKVDWVLGGILAAGSFVGGFAGARITVRKGHAWLRVVVTAAILSFAVLLWFR